MQFEIYHPCRIFVNSSVTYLRHFCKERIRICANPFFSSSVMNERCIKYPSGNVFSSIEAIYQENMSSRSVFGSEFVFVFFLGRGVKESGIPVPSGPGPVTDIPIFSPHFHTYLDYEQSLFFLRPWSETRKTRKWPRVLAEGTRRERREKREYTHLTKSEEKE